MSECWCLKHGYNTTILQHFNTTHMKYPNEQESILTQIGKPIQQVVIALSLGVVIMLVGWLLKVTGAVSVDPNFFWLTAASCLLLYAMFNAMISVSAESIDKYWKTAIPLFFGLMLVFSLLATVLSAISLSEAGSYSWIYVILTFGYLAFLSMARFIKRILSIAMREEERVREQERKRRGSS